MHVCVGVCESKTLMLQPELGPDLPFKVAGDKVEANRLERHMSTLQLATTPRRF